MLEFEEEEGDEVESWGVGWDRGRIYTVQECRRWLKGS